MADIFLAVYISGILILGYKIFIGRNFIFEVFKNKDNNSIFLLLAIIVIIVSLLIWPVTLYAINKN